MIMDETMERSCRVVSACETSIHALARLGDPKADLVVRMVKAWPSAIVARSEVSTFTGGLIAAKTLRNYDCEGKGPEQYGAINGRKVFYDCWRFAAWFKDHIRLYARNPQTEEYVEERPGRAT